MWLNIFVVLEVENETRLMIFHFCFSLYDIVTKLSQSQQRILELFLFMNTWVVITSTLFFRLTKFILILGAGWLLAKIIEKRLGKKRLLGITIGAILIITMSFYELIRLIDWDYYQFTFQGMSQQVIVARYIYSILWRIALLAAGVGLLYLNNKARMAVIFLAWFQILTIFWKHPLSVFKHLALYTQHETMPQAAQLVHPWIPWIGFLFFAAFDLTTAFLVIYYFNRPSTKQNFI